MDESSLSAKERKKENKEKSKYDTERYYRKLGKSVPTADEREAERARKERARKERKLANQQKRRRKTKLDKLTEELWGEIMSQTSRNSTNPIAAFSPAQKVELVGHLVRKREAETKAELGIEETRAKTYLSSDSIRKTAQVNSDKFMHMLLTENTCAEDVSDEEAVVVEETSNKRKAEAAPKTTAGRTAASKKAKAAYKSDDDEHATPKRKTKAPKSAPTPEQTQTLADYLKFEAQTQTKALVDIAKAEAEADKEADMKRKVADMKRKEVRAATRKFTIKTIEKARERREKMMGMHIQGELLEVDIKDDDAEEESSLSGKETPKKRKEATGKSTKAKGALKKAESSEDEEFFEAEESFEEDDEDEDVSSPPTGRTKAPDAEKRAEKARIENLTPKEALVSLIIIVVSDGNDDVATMSFTEKIALWEDMDKVTKVTAIAQYQEIFGREMIEYLLTQAKVVFDPAVWPEYVVNVIQSKIDKDKSAAKASAKKKAATRSTRRR